MRTSGLAICLPTATAKKASLSRLILCAKPATKFWYSCTRKPPCRTQTEGEQRGACVGRQCSNRNRAAAGHFAGGRCLCLPPHLLELRCFQVALQLDSQLVPQLLVIQLAQLGERRRQLRPLAGGALNPGLVAVRHAAQRPPLLYTRRCWPPRGRSHAAAGGRGLLVAGR